MKQIADNPKTRVAKVPSALNIHIILDTLKDGPLRDRRVRQAINYGVDKEGIIRSILEGNGGAVGGPLTPVMFGFASDVKPYPYDPERAKRLLAEAGFAQGISLTLNSPNGRYLKDKEVNEAIAGQLAKIGVRTQWPCTTVGHYVTSGPMAWCRCTDRLGGTWDADGSWSRCCARPALLTVDIPTSTPPSTRRGARSIRPAREALPASDAAGP